MRKQEVEQAKLAMEKDEAELSKLKNEESVLKGIVKQLKGITFFCYTSSCKLCKLRSFFVKGIDHKNNDNMKRKKENRTSQMFVTNLQMLYAVLGLFWIGRIK